MIVQAITGIDGKSYTRQQLAACQRNGLQIQGYIWCNHNGSAMTTLARLALFDGFRLEMLWLDVEETPLRQADVDRDLLLCDSYMDDNPRTGIYSARYVFAENGWLQVTKWSDRPLWAAVYDNDRDVDAGFVPFGGWTQPAVKQFIGTSSIGSVHQIDLDIAR